MTVATVVAIETKGITPAKVASFCSTELGLELTVVAFAIVASLPPERFRQGPGPNFVAMVKAHRAGRLNITGSFHGMRERAADDLCPVEPPARRARRDRAHLGSITGGILSRIRNPQRPG